MTSRKWKVISLKSSTRRTQNPVMFRLPCTVRTFPTALTYFPGLYMEKIRRGDKSYKDSQPGLSSCRSDRIFLGLQPASDLDESGSILHYHDQTCRNLISGTKVANDLDLVDLDAVDPEMVFHVFVCIEDLANREGSDAIFLLVSSIIFL